MIKKSCFDSRWIKRKHKEIKADPILIEKAIYVFELLGNLVENGVDLVFKGGTSLVLLIPELKRLSIDLDIVSPEGDPLFEEVFSDITGAGVFNRWETDQRSSNDKSTAFAPTTIGIPYRADKSMEIVKQLFDLGHLFEHIADLAEIHKTYEALAKIEADFRKTKPDIEEFLNDSIETALLISQLDFKGSIENDYVKEIRAGIRRINTLS